MKNTLLLPLLFSTAPALAQTSFHIGPRIGATVATVRYSDNPPYTRPTTAYKAGFEAGLIGSLQTGHFGIQPTIIFIQKGYKSQYALVPSPGTLPPTLNSHNVRLNYVTAQLNFAYTQHDNGQGLQLFAGPYISCLVGGSYHSDFVFYTLGSTSTLDGQVVAGDRNPSTPGSNDIYSKRWDIGLQAGVGYQYKNSLLQVGYSLGLRNLAATHVGGSPPTDLASTPAYSRGFYASISYLLNAKG